MNAADKAHATCHLCGRRAVAGAVFEVTAQESGSCAICPECRHRWTQRYGARRLVMAAVLGALFSGATLWDPEPNAARVVVNLCAGWFMMCVLILPHEFAHAFVARWLGLGTGKVHAGYGPLILHGTLFGFRFLWRAIPLSGHLEMGAPVRTPTLARLFFVYAAGPFSHLLMAATVWLALRAPDLSEFDPTRRVEWAWLFIGVNLLGFLRNMRPLWWKARGRPIVSDGLSMLQILFLRRKPFLPKWRPGLRWAWLGSLGFCAAGFLCVWAIILFQEAEAGQLSPWLCLAGGYAAWILAGVMRGGRFRRPGEKDEESGAGCIHTQVRQASRKQMLQEVVSLGDGGREVVKQMLRLTDLAGIAALIDRLAADYPDSFLPSLLTASRSLHPQAFPATQAACEECLRHELPPAIHAEALIEWLSMAALTHTMNPDAVRERITKFRETKPRDLELCCVLDGAATRVMECRCTGLLPDAEEWTAEMMCLAPGETTVAGTRGGVLIERGRMAEGESLLRKVLACCTSEVDEAIALLYLAIAAKQRGALKEADTLAGRARALLRPESGFSRRLQEEFPRLVTARRG